MKEIKFQFDCKEKVKLLILVFQLLSKVQFRLSNFVPQPAPQKKKKTFVPQLLSEVNFFLRSTVI